MNVGAEPTVQGGTIRAAFSAHTIPAVRRPVTSAEPVTCTIVMLTDKTQAIHL